MEKKPIKQYVADGFLMFLMTLIAVSIPIDIYNVATNNMYEGKIPQWIGLIQIFFEISTVIIVIIYKIYNYKKEHK